jgi:hypothetical protein
VTGQSSPRLIRRVPQYPLSAPPRAQCVPTLCHPLKSAKRFVYGVREMADPEKTKAQGDPDVATDAAELPPSGHPLLDNFFGQRGQDWTESDSRFFEAVTGEKDTFPTVPDPPEDLL